MKRRLPLVRVQPLAYSRQLRQSVLFRLQDVYHARRAGERRTRGERLRVQLRHENEAIGVSCKEPGDRKCSFGLIINPRQFRLGAGYRPPPRFESDAAGSSPPLNMVRYYKVE